MTQIAEIGYGGKLMLEYNTNGGIYGIQYPVLW